MVQILKTKQRGLPQIQTKLKKSKNFTFNLKRLMD